jgi:CheY-like chemotaxis protein
LERALSLLDLLYLEEAQAETVIATVRHWCAEHGCDISDENGTTAVRVAVGLSKSADFGGGDLLGRLSDHMTAIRRARGDNTILIVEDEPLIAMDIETVLHAEGLAVEYCTSREQALMAIAAKAPSAAVLDFHLKDGEATDIAVELQARDVPVVFCSGIQRSDIPQRFRNATWLLKPFNDRELVEAVSDALKIRDFRQQLEAKA